MLLLALVLTVACEGPVTSSPAADVRAATATPPVQVAPAPTPIGQLIASGDNWSFWKEDFCCCRSPAEQHPSDPPEPALSGLDGSFNSSGDAITAVLAPSGCTAISRNPHDCFNSDRDRVRFTGTRSGNAVQLQSQPLRDQVIQLTGTLSAAGDVFEGAYSITGGCGNGESGRTTGRRVNWTGVWSGTLAKIPAVFDLQMASTPDADGNYAVSGTAKFSNTECFPNAVITRRGRGRVLFPDVVSDRQRLELIAEVTEDLSTMYINGVLTAGTCPELETFEGQLVRQ